jgi:hypothetical protein
MGIERHTKALLRLPLDLERANDLAVRDRRPRKAKGLSGPTSPPGTQTNHSSMGALYHRGSIARRVGSGHSTGTRVGLLLWAATRLRVTSSRILSARASSFALVGAAQRSTGCDLSLAL